MHLPLCELFNQKHITFEGRQTDCVEIAIKSKPTIVMKRVSVSAAVDAEPSVEFARDSGQTDQNADTTAASETAELSSSPVHRYVSYDERPLPAIRRLHLLLLNAVACLVLALIGSCIFTSY